MVMDGTPSPQCVGREFVRQYYTLLNEGPQYLHRFYSHNSSFVHGGNGKSDEEEPEPVIGQADIHKKIMSLNFHDCHAKIRYVDSQATVGTAVVVQVTGELSNNQEPLRRFMQTFVLAPQSPNKYYVHNDIFRYQDEVFDDSEDDEDLCEPEQSVVHQPPVKSSPGQMTEQVEPTTLIENSMPQHFYQQQQPQLIAPVSEQHHAPQEPEATLSPTEPHLTNGHNEDHPSSLSPTPPAQSEPALKLELEPEVVQEQEQMDSTNTSGVANMAQAQTQQQQLSPDDSAIPSESQKKKLWANLLNNKSNTVPMPSAAPGIQTTGLQGYTADHSFHTGGTSSEKPASTAHKPHGMRYNRGAPASSEQRAGFGDQSSGGMKPGRVDEGLGGEEKRPERLRYPDSQQIFVGNLPGNISDFELKNFFKAHGAVLEVRVNRASTFKQPFGFVVFEDEACAQKLLATYGKNNQPLDYNGHKINIEVKKAREGRPQSNPRPRHMRGGSNRGFGGGQREHSGSRTEQGRYSNTNRSNQSRR